MPENRKRRLTILYSTSTILHLLIYPNKQIWVSQGLLFSVLMFAAWLFLLIVIAPSGISWGGGVLSVGLQLPNKGGHLYCAFVRYRSDKNVVNLWSTSTFYYYCLLLQTTFLTAFIGNFKCFKFTLSRLWSTGIYVVPAAGPAVLYVDILSIVGCLSIRGDILN